MSEYRLFLYPAYMAVGELNCNVFTVETSARLPLVNTGGLFDRIERLESCTELSVRLLTPELDEWSDSKGFLCAVYAKDMLDCLLADRTAENFAAWTFLKAVEMRAPVVIFRP